MARRRVSRLGVLVGAVAALGAGALLAAAASFHRGDVDRAFVAIAVATLFSDATWVNLRIRHHVESYTWAELTLALALAWLTPSQAVLSALSLGVAYAVTRRSPVKVLFNTTSYAFGVGLAALTTFAIEAPSWDAPAQSALAIAAGVMVFSLWNGATVDAAIAFSQDLPYREVFMRGAGLRTLVALGNLASGLLVLALAHYRPEALWAVPPAVGVVYLGYQSYLGVIQDRAAWRQLETTGQQINRLDEREVAEVALARAAALFDADEVELALYPDDGGPARVFLANSAGSATVVVDDAAARDEEFTVTTYRGDGSHARETCVVVPLAYRGVRLGSLRVRFFGAIKLSARERRLLNSFASTVATSVENARMFARMQAEAVRHETASRHDALTGLPNRVLFEERARTALQHRRRVSGFAVLLLDLDRFKEVNDTLGHAAGDAVLKEVAMRMRRCVRPQDTVSRLGGDEFAVLLDDAAAAEATGARLAQSVTEPIEVQGVVVTVGASIGYACYPADAIIYEELVRRADVAMYQAKQTGGAGAGRRYRRYNPETDRAVMDDRRVVEELRAALDADGDSAQLELHFQPQLDLRTGLAIGAEALVRWRHPVRGLLAPAHFLAAVESSSLLRRFTCRVLDMAVAECASWHRAGRPLTVSVNLSARSLTGGTLVEDVAEVLERHGLPPSRLVVEVSEAAMPAELDLAESQLTRLAALGVGVAIDHFGTGRVSLPALRRMRVREVKLDKSFTSAIASCDDSAAIAEATVHLARSLGLRTVAEGVEEPRVAERLIDLGCDCAQGFHWSRPVPAAEARTLLGVGSPFSTGFSTSPPDVENDVEREEHDVVGQAHLPVHE